MQRPIVLLLALLVLLPNLSKAQSNSSQLNGTRGVWPEGSHSMAVSLLQQSHDLNPQFNLGTRIYLLQRQAEAMSRVDSQMGHAWAQELLTLSTQTKGSLRSFSENSAMSILVRLNPDQALLLLHSLSKDEPQESSVQSLPNRQLVQNVFAVLVERDGVSALPLLEQEAARIGTDGPYPYRALGNAAVQSVLKDWGTNQQRAIEVTQRVYDRAFQRYSEGSRNYFDDYEFGGMLQEVGGGLPHESIRPALRLLVKNLLATDTSKYRFEAEVYTADGKTAKAENAIDAALLSFGGLINRVDPELAQQLESTRPELHTALQYAQDGRIRSWSFHGVLRSLGSRPPDQDATRLAQINSEAAVAKADQLPKDDRRADTKLEIARQIAGNDAVRAQGLIAEVEGENKTGIPELQLDVISAKASVAASLGRKDETRELLQQGFGLATPIIVELQKSGNVSFVPGLGQLVQLGMQNDPDSTITFIQSVPAPWMKANLLLGAASALTIHARLPAGSAQKLEQLKH